MIDNTVFILRAKFLCFDSDNNKTFATVQNFWPPLQLIQPPTLGAKCRLSQGDVGKNV